MKAAQYRRRGPPEDVLELVNVPMPEPGVGEIRVRVMASAVNPSDTKARSLRPNDTLMAFDVVTPHQDGAGIIDAVGAGVDSARIGERVWLYMCQRGRPHGTAAHYAVVPAERACRLPDAASFLEGACLGIPAMTAHYALFSYGDIAGKTVLVQGGAGAVGFYAIQMARWAGAQKVIATVSRDEQARQALLAGADLVINRRTEDPVSAILAACPPGVDRIIEVAFGANQTIDMAVIATNGVIAAYASDAEPEPTISVRRLMARNVTLRFVLIYEAPQIARNHAARNINAMIESGVLRHQIGDVLALEAIIEAHQRMESGRTVGKLLIDMSL